MEKPFNPDSAQKQVLSDKHWLTCIHSISVFSPLEAAKHLGVAEELAKVDVEHVTSGAQHNIVIMAITDAQHVGCHTASRT